MEMPTVWTSFAKGSCPLLGWMLELPFPQRGAEKQQGQVLAMWGEILQNWQRQWEAQAYLQDCIMQVTGQQQQLYRILQEKSKRIIRAKNRKGIPGPGGQRPNPEGTMAV